MKLKGYSSDIIWKSVEHIHST